MTLRARILLVSAALLGVSSGMRSCDERECVPCDAVRYLEWRQTPDTRWKIPEQALKHCADWSDEPRIAEFHDQHRCPELTAFYLVDSVSWQESELDVSWDEQTSGEKVCVGAASTPLNPLFLIGSLAGCASEEPADSSLVGPLEGTPIVMPSATGGVVSGGDAGEAESGSTTDDAESDETSATSATSGPGDGDPSVAEIDALGVYNKARAVAMLMPTAEIALARLDVLENLQSLDPGGECPELVFPADNDPCTAFLIAPRYVLTARHCLTGWETQCSQKPRLEDATLLFDYLTIPSEALHVSGMTAVACGEKQSDYSDDWLLIELDEPLQDRIPLQLPAPDYGPAECDLIFSIAHPLGRPQYRLGTQSLAEPSAWVTGAPDGTFFTTIDSLRSMSGAPIFDMQGHLVGLHTRGKDFTTTSASNSMLATCKAFKCGAVGCSDHEDYGEAIALMEVRDEIASHMKP